MRRLTIIIITVIYAWLALYFLPSTSFFSGDEGVKFLQTRSLALNRYQDSLLEHPGRNLFPDRFFPFQPPYAFIRAGKMYSTWPILFPFVSSFFYQWLGVRGLYVIPLVSAVAILMLSVWMCRLLGVRPSWFYLLVFGLGTPLIFYSAVFWEHSLAVMFVTAAIVFLLREVSQEKHSLSSFAFSGLLLGFGIWARNELYLFALAAIIAYAMIHKDREQFKISLAVIAMGLGLVLVPMWMLQKAIGGDFLGRDVSQFLIGDRSLLFNLRSLGTLMTNRIFLVATLLFHPLNRKETVWYGIPFVLLSLTVISERWRKNALSLVVVLALFFVSAFSTYYLWHNPYWHASGLLAVVPFLSVFPLVFAHPYKLGGKDEVRFIVYMGCIFVFLVFLFSPSLGGAQWGPRFLLPIIPLWSPLIFLVHQDLKKLDVSVGAQGILGITIIALFFMSILSQGAGIRMLYWDRKEGAKLVSYLQNTTERVFITDTFWFPQETAIVYPKKRYFLVNNQDEFNEIAAELVSKENIESFSYVTFQQNEKPFSIRGTCLADRVRQGKPRSIPNGFLSVGFHKEKAGNR